MPLGEFNLFKCIHFLDGQQSMGNSCTRKLLLNLFQRSNISKFYIKKTYRSAGYREITTCPIKVMSRSEFKFLSISFFGCLIHFVLCWLQKALQRFQKINVYEENIKLIFNFQLFTCFEGCRVWFAGYGAWFVGCGVWNAGELVQFNMTKCENDILCQ